jgi:hypothetical protein
MRRSVRIAALTASLATVLSGGLAATVATVASAGTASASAGPGASVHVINLHSAYRAALARGTASHKKIIMLPRGARVIRRHVPALGLTPLAQRLAGHVGHRTRPRIARENRRVAGALRFAPIRSLSFYYATP